MQHYQMFIGGRWVEGSTGERFESVDPYTGKPWATVAKGNEADAALAVETAHAAMRSGPWATMSASARGALLRRLGDAIAENAKFLGEIETRDNGKLIAEMGLQVRYLPQFCYYYAGLADKIEGTVPPVERPGYFNYTRNEPVGVAVAITPWNSPLMLGVNKVATALAAGCAVVVKPSEFTSASTLELARLVEKVGFPPGVFNVVCGYGQDVGAALVRHPKTAKVSFTGSEYGGRTVYEAAARGFKSVTLELGGKSPNIVFDDANLEDAVRGAVSGIFAASGQTCIAGSRLLLHESIHDEFVERLLAYARTARIGNPMLGDTQVGPVTTPPQYRKILDYIDVAKSEGAELVLGGGASDVGEWFVQPTIFTNVDNRMRIAQEEVFGPVLSVIKFRDQEEAVAIANDTMYGLAAGVWTQNVRRMFTMANAIEAGTVWVNTYRAASYTTPFGGYKNSGLGHESGMNSIRQYLKTKSVWINFDADVPNPFVMRLT